MAKMKSVPKPPFWMFDHIHVFYELTFGKDVIRPGDKIKIKSIHGEFKFQKWVQNSKIDVAWIDCMDVKTGEFRSFRIEDLKSLIKPKKSRRKKPNV